MHMDKKCQKFLHCLSLQCLTTAHFRNHRKGTVGTEVYVIESGQWLKEKDFLLPF